MTEPRRGQSRLRQLPGALLLALIGAGTLALAWFTDELVRHADRAAPYYRSPDFFPRLALLVAGCGALGLAWRHLRYGPGSSDESLPRTRPRPLLVLALIVLFGAYILAVPWLGYHLSTGLFVASGLILAGRGLLGSLLASVVLAASLWLVFVQLLGVWFPVPRLFGN